MKVSVTDPEAALGLDKAGTLRPLYNVPLVQATDAPLTLAWDVLARNHDDGLLKPMMEKTEQQRGRPLEEVLVDGAFVSVGEAVWCEEQGIVVYAPPDPASQQVYKQRKQSVELGYADLKEHRGMRVFRCFSRQRARAQAGLVILASNGLKIMQALKRRQSAAEHPARPEEQRA